MKTGASEAGVFPRGEIAFGADGEEEAGGAGGGGEAAQGEEFGNGKSAGGEGGDEFLPIRSGAGGDGEPGIK